MKKTKTVSCGLVIASMLGQNLAFGYDSSRLSSLSPDAQRVRSSIRQRIDNMSESSKLRLSYRLYKLSLRAFPKLEQMSDEDFGSELQAAVTGDRQSVAEPTSEEEGFISQDDLKEVLPDEGMLSSVNATPIPSDFVKHTEFTRSVRMVLDQIGFHETTGGGRRPLTRAEFNEKALHFAEARESATTFKAERSSEWLGTILEILLYVVIVLASVGLIVTLGWMGVAIFMGAIAITLLVFLICIFSGIGAGLRGR